MVYTVHVFQRFKGLTSLNISCLQGCSQDCGAHSVCSVYHNVENMLINAYIYHNENTERFFTMYRQ